MHTDPFRGKGGAEGVAQLGVDFARGHHHHPPPHAAVNVPCFSISYSCTWFGVVRATTTRGQSSAVMHRHLLMALRFFLTLMRRAVSRRGQLGLRGARFPRCGHSVSLCKGVVVLVVFFAIGESGSAVSVFS